MFRDVQGCSGMFRDVQGQPIIRSSRWDFVEFSKEPATFGFCILGIFRYLYLTQGLSMSMLSLGVGRLPLTVCHKFITDPTAVD